jgi:SEC-C motif
MTIIVTGFTNESVILIADRRISSQHLVHNDEFNKICIYACHDARVCIALTGLATNGTFSTIEWLTKFLSQLKPRTITLHASIDELRENLNLLFSLITTPKIPTTLVIAGFQYGELTTPFLATLSNEDNFGAVSNAFSIGIHNVENSRVLVEGAIKSFNEDVGRRLHGLLQEELTYRQLLRFCVKHIQNAARNEISGIVVGEQLSSVFIESTIDTNILASYHSADYSGEFFSPSFVVVGGIAIFESRVGAEQILSGPDVRKRDFCWCGSGLKFKLCHMKHYGAASIRTNMFKVPLAPFARCELSEAGPSGKYFSMSSGFF